MLTDVAPVPVRHRVRGRPELRGQLRGQLEVAPLHDAAAVCEVETGRRLDRGRVVLRLRPDVVLLDGTEVDPQT